MSSRLSVTALFLGACFAASAGQLTFNFTGNFTLDNDVQLFNVTLTAPALVTAWTTSGATGGFPTYLSMFSGSGTQFGSASGAPACATGFSSLNSDGLCNDAVFSEPPPGLTLDPGTYIVALSQWENGPIGDLADGFFYSVIIPDSNFTAQPYCSGVGGPYFCDGFNWVYRSSAWAVTIQFDNPDGPVSGTVTQGAEVPEPASGPLVFFGGLAAAWWVRSRRRAHHSPSPS